ncbi:MAG TPA: O-antigen ligase family protein [Candidatus Methanoperedens sp.]|nr:O-antigen ligase family protein [Candidatus Methanoperedens sp.]
MERFLTIFWLLLIPTQLGRHFWLDESSVMGVRIDYLSFILYATDIAWFLWLIFKIKNEKLDFKKQINKLLTFQNFILLLFVLVNVSFAQARWVAIYHWLRLWQWWITWQLIKSGKLVNMNKIKEILRSIVPIWIIFESFLGLAQVIKGGSINGLLWWIGERKFTYGGIGIAQIRFFDEGWIRAYGSFSHPNSLAGFLLLAWWWFRQQFRSSGGQGFNRVWYWIVNWSAILGIVLSGSRVVWVLTLLMLVVEQLPLGKNFWKDRKFIGKIFLFFGVIMLLLGLISVNYRIRDFLGGWDIQSLQKREKLALSALKMIKDTPLFGVGLGNFMVKLPSYQGNGFYWMQPVHNIFLLVWSEVGVLGMILFLIFIAEHFLKIKWRKKYWFLLIVGISGMMDHYWVTLPQNSWLLAIILGLI